MLCCSVTHNHSTQSLTPLTPTTPLTSLSQPTPHPHPTLDVAKDIPPKEETLIDVELTNTQKQYYRAIFEHNHGFLMQTVKGGNLPKLMNIQMELRKVCNHPWLVGGIEETDMEKVEGGLSDTTRSRLGSMTTGE